MTQIVSEPDISTGSEFVVNLPAPSLPLITSRQSRYIDTRKTHENHVLTYFIHHLNSQKILI